MVVFGKELRLGRVKLILPVAGLYIAAVDDVDVKIWKE